MMRNKTFSAINIAGLALSMSVSLVLIMLVSDQISYDKYNTNHERIYRIVHDNLNNNGVFSKMATSPPQMGRTLQEEYPGIEKVARLRRGFGNDWIDFEKDVNIPIGGFFADPEVLDVLQYDLQYGDKETALLNPRSVVITPEARDKLFTIADPTGEIIKVGDLGEYKVTGVLKEAPKKSHIKFEALASASTLPVLVKDSIISSDFTSWSDRWAGWTYLLLEEGVDPKQVEASLAEINEQQYGDDEEVNVEFQLQALDAINPGPLMGNQIGPGMPMFIVYFLGGLCLLIMVSAGFNYANISIARSLKRAREVGVRKVSGAYRSQIFNQFISESIIISLISLVVAFVFLQLLEPAFHNLNFSRMLHWDLSYSATALMVSVVFAIGVGLIAGLFPALLLSALKPVDVLKKLSGVRLFSRMGWRKALLVIQFGLSLFLIVSVRVANDQLNMMVNANHGFDPVNIINVKIGETSYDQLVTALRQYSELSSVSGASFTPSTGRSHGSSFFVEDDTVERNMNHFAVDRDYLTNMSIPLVTGKDFPETVSKENEQYVIINEAAVSFLGFEDPHEALGQSIREEDSDDLLQVIGVVADYNHQPMTNEIGPLALRYLPERFGQIQVKFSGDREKAVELITASWSEINPDKKLDFQYMDEEISQFYDFMFGDVVSITSTITVLAITIACLGLLGMAIYTTESREKEVSIRKVMGASGESLVLLLSGGFIKLLLIAAVISLPLTYLFNEKWLDLMAYKVGVTPGSLLFGVGILLGLGALTIVSQTFRAAYHNPADKLRGE